MKYDWKKIIQKYQLFEKMLGQDNSLERQAVIHFAIADYSKKMMELASIAGKNVSELAFEKIELKQEEDISGLSELAKMVRGNNSIRGSK